MKLLVDVHPPFFKPFHLVSLNAITRFNIPAVVPLEGEVSYAEIAESNVALTKALVQSLMRHAIARGIFADSDRPGYVRHNATSRLLATNPGMMDYLFVATNNFWPAGSRCVDAMVKYPGSGEANETVPIPHPSAHRLFSEERADCKYAGIQSGSW